MIGHILKMWEKTNVCFIEIIWSVIIKIDLGQHINKNMLNKEYLSMATILRIKQHLSNIWSSIHGKVKQHRDWVKKIPLLIKKRT